MTVPYAEVIGDPVDHSKSPVIHKFWLDKLGIEADYRRTRVTAVELASFIATRRSDPAWCGCNVTIPHKQAVMPLLDDNRDAGIGAVNCILPVGEKLVGRNTDKAAVDRILSESFGPGVTIAHPVCLLGSGGAARAAMAALRESSVGFVNVVVRQRTKGESLLKAFAMAGAVYEIDDAPKALSDALGLINATPLGMIGAPAMPDSVLSAMDAMHRDAFVFDMVYAPRWTDLLESAARLGLDVVDGLEMLIAQAREAFSLFFASEPPEAVPSELRELLTR
ncbi:MAG: shikimate dehydrogenase [Sphingomonadales bacterium]|jgi:shikimate dehydrogenase|nr:shikimate dehydrogenase [Sphingomonadales bacterium]